jgi:hypothetical protein
VTDSTFKSDPTTSDNLYTFTAPAGGCYLAELIPEQKAGSPGADNSYKEAWVEQDATDCSSQTYFDITSAQSDGLQALPPLGVGTSDTTSAPAPDTNNCKTSDCFVTAYVEPFIKFLTAVVSLAVVISVVTGGIQYSTSRDNPEAVKAARKRITNALVGLVCYFLLFAFLNFIIPGGL